MFKIKSALFAVTLLCVGAVFAQSPPITTTPSAASEIAKINESIAVLMAKKQELQLRAEVAAKQSEVDRMSGSGGIYDSSDKNVLPVIQGIEGANGKLFATLAFGSGTQQTVKTGDQVHGGWIVQSIDVNSVTIARNGHPVRLLRGDAPSISSSNGVSPPGQPSALPMTSR
jgi:type IV pilus biogenesis protein PilP